MKDRIEKLILSIYPKIPFSMRSWAWIRKHIYDISERQLDKTKKELYRMKWEQARLQKLLKEKEQTETKC